MLLNHTSRGGPAAGEGPLHHRLPVPGPLGRHTTLVSYSEGRARVEEGTHSQGQGHPVPLGLIQAAGPLGQLTRGSVGLVSGQGAGPAHMPAATPSALDGRQAEWSCGCRAFVLSISLTLVPGPWANTGNDTACGPTPHSSVASSVSISHAVNPSTHASGLLHSPFHTRARTGSFSYSLCSSQC